MFGTNKNKTMKIIILLLFAFVIPAMTFLMGYYNGTFRFVDEEARSNHEGGWTNILTMLDEVLSVETAFHSTSPYIFMVELSRSIPIDPSMLISIKVKF